MRLPVFSLGLSLLASTSFATVVTFDDLPLDASGVHNNSSFTDAGVTFANNFDSTFGSFAGFAYSNIVNTTTAGYANQFADIAGGGHGGSSNYAIAYDPTPYGSAPSLTLPYTATVAGVYVTNTTYTFLALRDGNDGGLNSVRQFGDNPSTPTHGDEGQPDLYTLTVTGYNSVGGRTGSILVPLADYTSPDNSGDYVVSDWRFVDTSSLGPVASLSFSLASTDVGTFGVNTPTYFAMDDLTYSPEPNMLAIGAVGLFLRRRR